MIEPRGHDGSEAAHVDLRMRHAHAGGTGIALTFHGAVIWTCLLDAVPHVAMRPIVEHLGLNWSGQQQRLMRHPVLSTSVRVTRTQIPGDDQQRDMLVLPIGMLSGWLFGVQVSRAKPELRDLLTAYQAECFAVLDAYWRDGVAVNPRIHVIPDDEPWNCASDGKSIGRRFAEERERWERRHGRSFVGMGGLTKNKLRALEEHERAFDGDTIRILMSFSFDLPFIFFGERTLTDSERGIRNSYRLGSDDDRLALRRHAEAVRIARAPDAGWHAEASELVYAGADSPDYVRLPAPDDEKHRNQDD